MGAENVLQESENESVSSKDTLRNLRESYNELQ